MWSSEGGEAHIAQKCGGGPIHEDFQDQAGPGSEKPDLALCVPVHCKELE